ncbi:MAG: response regulator [Myxococcales bacterium]|nr:response regulator [Myxococcales bacterium]MBK7193162.1 response regulator [Myxococcales bacterium]MBP6845105.1 response regulator [Kofleriaceae bacterium]
MTSPVSILIVDDDDDVRAALYDELSRDYKVESATCGEEAFAALASRTYDVVISDLKMPDHDGIEVLDFARVQDPGVIRILLTGYADERAHAALLRPDAPFKVGKPWYDEIEVVLRRALEQRQRTNDLTSTLESAIGLGDVDTQLTAVGSLEELGEVVTLRIAQLANVETAWLRRDGEVQVGQPQLAAPGGWQIDQAIDRDGRIRIGAVGAGALARDMVEHLIQSAQRRAGAIVVSAHAPGVTRSRIDELMRHATIGTLTGSLLHDVASMLQSVDGAVAALVDELPAGAAPELIEAAHDVTAVTREAFELFVATRKFLSDGVVKPRRVPVAQLVQRVVRHCGGAVRERAQLRVVVDADLELDLADTLFVRSLADLVTAASTLAPAGAHLELRVDADPARVRFTIIDDGPGVPAPMAAALFEPLSWNRPTELPIRLAIAAYTLRGIGVDVAYRRGEPTGSCFVVEVPRAAPT